MNHITRESITEQHLGLDALRELVLLGIKAKYPTDSIVEVLDIKPGQRNGFDLTVRRTPQEADFMRAILDVDAEHAVQAITRLTRAGNYFLGFSKALLAREYKLAIGRTPGSLTPAPVAEALRQLDLGELQRCAAACAAGTPWTGA
jgi:hypothetical protein